MIKRFVAYLVAAMALLSCTSTLEDQEVVRGMDPSLEGKPVTITFSVPAEGLSAHTKGVEDDEGLITSAPYLDPEKFYIAVCGSSQSIKYIRKAELVSEEVVSSSSIPGYPITDDDGTTSVTVYKFSVQLELSDSHRTIHFLGNIDESQLNTGSYSYQILPTLMSYPGRQAYWQKVFMESIHPLEEDGVPVMQGGSYLPSAETSARLRYIPLIRNYAMIRVTDATPEEDGFELHSYAVIYYPANGSVVPYRSNVGTNEDPFSFGSESTARLSGYESCSFSDLDETLHYLGTMPQGVELDKTIPTAAMFENPEASGGRVLRYDASNPDQGFYIYERPVPNDNLSPTFVIIRGKFGNDDQYYYYRLDLMETKVENNESVFQYYPVYRNFRYDIKLNRISSVGVSTPELAAVSSGAEDISADVSMKHLGDISNGLTRLVVEPFMSKTYTGPNEEGYYYLYARFYNDVNSADPNTDWGAVSAELVPMEDNSEDILTLYDDVGNEVHAFYPSAQEMGGEPGFRIIRFNTKVAGNETKTQKIKITGRNLYTHEQYPLYREVEISLQKRQSMVLGCSHDELPLQNGARQELTISIPSGLPASMFPLDFTIEAELPTLTPDNSIAGNNLPVTSGISISETEGYKGKNTIQFIRTLTLDEYRSLSVVDGMCTFSSYFKTNRPRSATTIWVANEFFSKASVSFTNMAELTGHFWVKIDDDADTNCFVKINQGNLECNVDDSGWKTYTKNDPIELERGHKVAFRSTTTINGWNSRQFYCYKKGSADSERNGQFSVGGNIASLIMGDDYVSEAESYTGAYSFTDLFKEHKGLIDASELILPMLNCQSNCYKSLFHDCSSLVKGPKELPATKMANTCYRNMFYGCSSLTDAPYIAVTNIEQQCMQQMFRGCTSLKCIKMNGANYVANCFTDWVTGLTEGGEIWLNPDIRTSSGYQNVVPKGNNWQWTVKTLPDGELWNNN